MWATKLTKRFRFLPLALVIVAACRGYLGSVVPAAQPLAGCYALRWTRGEHGSYPDTLCLIARLVDPQPLGGSSNRMLALGPPVGEPNEAWFGHWWWESRNDSLFVIVSNGYTGLVLRGQPDSAEFPMVLEGCGDVDPPFCTWHADAIAARPAR